MTWTTFVGIYIVLWWVALFAVLPLGSRSQHESGEIIPGTDPGAPMLPNLRAKLWLTTLVSGVLFLVFCVVYFSNLIDIEKFSTLWGLLPPPPDYRS